jgi:hypothetical protein
MLPVNQVAATSIFLFVPLPRLPWPWWFLRLSSGSFRLTKQDLDSPLLKGNLPKAGLFLECLRKAVV